METPRSPAFNSVGTDRVAGTSANHGRHMAVGTIKDICRPSLDPAHRIADSGLSHPVIGPWDTLSELVL